jgi:Carboxypeptidase regulatory-like domain
VNYASSMLRAITMTVVTSWVLLLPPVGLSVQKAAKAHLEISVTDVTGGLVPGADIRISQASDAVQPIFETNKDGQLRVDVAPGSYDVSAVYPGFRQSKQHIEVSGSEVRSVSFKLLPGSCPPGPCLTVTTQREPSQPLLSIQTPQLEALPAICKGQDFTQTGVPLFSGDQAGVQYGISLSGTHFDPYSVPLRVWVDNESGYDLTLGACSMFTDWNIDVWEGTKRMVSRWEQRDGKRWREGSPCAADPIVNIKAHSCSAISKIDLAGWYGFSSSVYSVVAQSRHRGTSSKPPGQSDRLVFQVVAP